ncbi:MAG: hypothetical protein ABSB32_09115, partial [Thermodesulfobacteriota bacterium]
CRFCSSARSFALWLPSDNASRRCPCLRLVLMLVISIISRITYRGLSPHQFTPMPGVHNRLQRIANKSGSR